MLIMRDGEGKVLTAGNMFYNSLDAPKNPKLYKIPHYIESCGTCMEH